MNNQKQQSDWIKEFVEICWNEELGRKIFFRKREILKSFISSLLEQEEANWMSEIHEQVKQARAECRAEILKEVLPEEGIKWMQEGSNKDRKGFTDGFNSCRQQIIDKALKMGIKL